MSVSVRFQNLLYFILRIFSPDSYNHNYLLPFLRKGSLLSDHDIKSLLKENQLIIEPHPLSINPSSIDLTLGSILVKYTPQTIKIDSGRPRFNRIDIKHTKYTLKSGEFILGTTKEKVCIPNGYQGIIETKGNMARAGFQIKNKSRIQVHNNDAHIDAGFCGQITLEIKNMHEKDISIELEEGFPICQLFICQLSSKCDTPYNGKYLNQTKPTVYRP